MVIGLVNSELMALTEAIGVIIGANIGTTITGWILALKIGQYGLPLLGLAAFGWLEAESSGRIHPELPVERATVAAMSSARSK